MPKRIPPPPSLLYRLVIVLAVMACMYLPVANQDEPNHAAIEVDTDAVMQVLHSLDRAAEVVPVPLLMPSFDEQPRIRT